MKDTKISIFRYLYESKDVPYIVTIEKALERIKNGAKSKDIINKIRSGTNAEEIQKLKFSLPCYVFSGEFKERNQNGLIKHSGLCILDFDKIPSDKELQKCKESLINISSVLAVFKSPSGKGLKAVIRIPESDKITHPRYFKEFQKLYNLDYFDISNSNVDRVCFESYDPEIYINWNAKVFDVKLNDEGYSVKDKVPLLPIENDSDIVEKIMAWHWGKDFVEGQRNAYIFDIAGAFCEYGVSKDYAEGYILNNIVHGDFTESEALNTIKSAYRTRQYKSKYFEDYQRAKSIRKDLSKGKDIVLKKHKITEDVYNEIKVAEEINDFWTITTDKNGNEKIKVDLLRYKKFLESSGFKKYFPHDTQKPTWVKIESNQVEETSVEKIKDFVLDYLSDRAEFKVWNYFAGYQNLFTESLLLMLDTVNLLILSDTKTTSYIAFQNGILEVTKDKINLVEYVDVDGYIWKSHIIKRDFIKSEKLENDYKTFIFNISNQKPLAIETSIGYLLCCYKNKMNNKAIILNDEVITDNPEGGTGKGLFIQGIQQIRRVSILDGKAFDDKKSFPYQTVSPETQILVFDDVKKNFDFESKFSLVTEGMTLERKNKDAIKLKVEDSPKVVISTNYAIKGEGNSHDRRRHELEVSQHYSKIKTPYDEFKREIFSDWDKDDFIAFDNYMVSNLQKYFIHGLVQQESVNIKKRKFIAETSMEFLEWVCDEENLRLYVKNDKAEKFAQFTNEYKDYQKWLTRKKFDIWLQKYATYIDLKYYSGHSGSYKWFMINKPDMDEAKLNEYTNNFEPLIPPF
jgi:hypothetical protein